MGVMAALLYSLNILTPYGSPSAIILGLFLTQAWIQSTPRPSSAINLSCTLARAGPVILRSREWQAAQFWLKSCFPFTGSPPASSAAAAVTSSWAATAPSCAWKAMGESRSDKPKTLDKKWRYDTFFILTKFQSKPLARFFLLMFGTIDFILPTLVTKIRLRVIFKNVKVSITTNL